jgi:phosphomannomutase
LGIDALALPVSCNTNVESSQAFKQVKRTRIGSPYVIEAFDSLCQSSDAVAGFEANGGFLLASDLTINGQSLAALPTRDAVLPAIAVLAATKQHGTVMNQVAQLPQRFTASNRLQGIDRSFSQTLIEKALQDQTSFLDQLGLSYLGVCDVDQTDGLRLHLTDNSYLHLRPSGNAPELRCYIETDSMSVSTQRVIQVLNQIKTLTA